MPTYFAGFFKGKLQRHWVRDPGTSRVTLMPAIYASKSAAARDWRDVRKVEVKVIPLRKRTISGAQSSPKSGARP